MSSLTKKPTKSNPPFYFYENKGWKIETKIKVNGEFKKFSRCWYRTLSDAKADFQAQANEFIAKYAPKPETKRADVSWEEFRERYLDYRRTQVRGSTLYVDKTRFHTLFDPLFGNMDVKNVFKRENALKIQQKIRLWSANRKNKNRALSHYLQMLEYAFEHEYLEEDSDYRKCKSEIVLIKSTEEEDKVAEKTILTSEQWNALLEHIDDAKDKMLTTIMYETGIRIGEALALRCCDITDDGLCVSRTEASDEFGQRKQYNRTKTRLGLRTIPMSEELRLIVASYCAAFRIKGNDLLFPSYEDKACSMDGSAYRHRLTAYCKEAGVPRITPHCLRHSFATALSNLCRTDSDRQARAYIMGHSVTVDEQIYTAHNQFQNAKKLIGGN